MSVADATTTVAEQPRNLDTIQRPPVPSTLAFGSYWLAPEFTRRQLTKRGERMLIDIPLLPKLLFTSSPQDCKAIFTERDGALKLGEALRQMAPHEMLFGAEMIDWWNGSNHALLRKKVTPAFNGNALRGYEEAIVDAAAKRVAEWPVNEPVRFTGLMRELARDVIMSVVFGVTETDRRRRLEQAFIDLDHALASPGMIGRYMLAMARGGKWPSFEKLDAINATIDAITLEEIEYRRNNPSDDERKDCLELFLQMQRDDEDELMDDHMIAVFQRMLLIAGYETTAVTLSWVAERIVRHPQVLEKLNQSVADGDDDYLDAVITEVMRLRPALPVTMRYAAKDFVLNDVLVPEGTVIVVYINAIHKRADLYPEPEKFDPDRFLGVRSDPHRWMPFGGGAHRCLGASFAMFESRVLLRTILQHRRFQPEATPDERQDQHRNILLLPHKGATVTLLPRSV
ncbi:cytochrome P450 [Mycobacterium sp. DL440]|uniref:cytochrome P450 n=1 Tax=Mycobacterium sp. DL440 TaxID=2675523 RepID=UPI001420F865|nr:cytochrome P450 [Mycobacterium sp. DL440]